MINTDGSYRERRVSLFIYFHYVYFVLSQLVSFKTFVNPRPESGSVSYCVLLTVNVCVLGFVIDELVCFLKLCCQVFSLDVM